MIKLFSYVMTSDTGFAPCIDREWLTLACCKGGKGNKSNMRKSIVNEIERGNQVWVMGVCGSTLVDNANKDGFLEEKDKNIFLHKPIYLAKIEEIIPYEQYFSGMSNGRRDDAYRYNPDGKMKSEKFESNGKGKNPHDGCEDIMLKDYGDEEFTSYVLSSRKFIYWGNRNNSNNLSEADDISTSMQTQFPELLEEIKSQKIGFKKNNHKFDCEKLANWAMMYLSDNSPIILGEPINGCFTPEKMVVIIKMKGKGFE